MCFDVSKSLGLRALLKTFEILFWKGLIVKTYSISTSSSHNFWILTMDLGTERVLRISGEICCLLKPHNFVGKLNYKSIPQVLGLSSTNIIKTILKFKLSCYYLKMSQWGQFLDISSHWILFFPMREVSVEFEPEILLKVNATSLHLSLPVLLCIFFWYSPCIVNGDCHVIKSLLITRACFYAEISIRSLLQDP